MKSILNSKKLKKSSNRQNKKNLAWWNNFKKHRFLLQVCDQIMEAMKSISAGSWKR